MADRECTKVKFRNEKDCDFYIEKLKNTSSRTVVPLRAYLCPWCTCWHLTSKQEHYGSAMELLRTEIKELKQTIKSKNELITTLNEKIHKLKSQR